MFRAVLFDMDGVLVFTEQYYNRRRMRYLEQQGVVPEAPLDCTGLHDDEAWEHCVPDDVALRDRLRAGYQRYAEQDPTPWRELANRHAQETFARLRERRVRTAICSSSPRDLIVDCMAHLGIAGLTDFVISGDECVAHKPSPEIYLRAMVRLGVRPEEAIVVEDSPIGIRAGKESGALVCAMAQPLGVILNQGEADIVIDDLRELVAIAGGGLRVSGARSA